jgi:hypothetical protein
VSGPLARLQDLQLLTELLPQVTNDDGQGDVMRAVYLGLGRIVALYCPSSALYHIH